MDVNQPLALLGGLSPQQFMRKHWQKKPLLVRNAWPDVRPPLSRSALFELAGREGVESRLLTRFDGDWRLKHGPFSRRQLPALTKPDWTLLVQGVDLHADAAHQMLAPFRFVPDMRLDDLMVSYATDGGGVGPHLDSYDVFLLQVKGRRRWRAGPVADRSLVPDRPVRLLAKFEPIEEWLLEAGDMLYLPPMWGHDGVAEGECMTCSVGFRAPSAGSLAQELLQALAEELAQSEAPAAERLYRDAGQAATSTPGRLAAGLRPFAERALALALRDPRALDRALGQLSTEPKPNLWFDAGQPLPIHQAVALDRRTRMAYDDRHVYINGESFDASGKDAVLVRRLADQRWLSALELKGLSPPARALLDDWCQAGWLRGMADI